MIPFTSPGVIPITHYLHTISGLHSSNSVSAFDDLSACSRDRWGKLAHKQLSLAKVSCVALCASEDSPRRSPQTHAATLLPLVLALLKGAALLHAGCSHPGSLLAHAPSFVPRPFTGALPEGSASSQRELCTARRQHTARGPAASTPPRPRPPRAVGRRGRGCPSAGLAGRADAYATRPARALRPGQIPSVHSQLSPFLASPQSQRLAVYVAVLQALVKVPFFSWREH